MFESTEERTITLKRSDAPYDNGTTEQIGKHIANAAQEGYSLVSVEEVKASDYRKSWFDGVKLTFRKES